MGDRKTSAIVLTLAIFVFAGAAGYFIYHPDLSKLAVTLNRSRASDEPTLSLALSNNNPQIGDEFTVSINLDTGNREVSAAELHLKVSPNVEIVSFSMSSGYLLPISLPGFILPGLSFTKDQAMIVLGSNPDNPRTGSGTLALLILRAVSEGDASIEFTSDTKVAALYSAGNVLDGAQNISITVGTPGPPTPTPVAGTLYGDIDSADCDAINGWTLDTSKSDEPLVVEVAKDKSYMNGGQIVYQEPTDATRSDINDLFKVSGRHGFSIPIPDSLRDGKYHPLFIYALDADDQWRRLPYGTGNVATPNITCPPKQTLGPNKGYVDGLNPESTAIVGWAAESQDRPAEVTIKFSHKVLPGVYAYDGFVRQTTNLVRKDVNRTYGLTGPHGFSYPLYFIPDQFKDGQDYKLEFVTKGGGLMGGGPLYLTGQQIQNVPAPDSDKYNSLIDEISAELLEGDVDMNFQKAIDSNLIVARQNGDTSVAVVFNPEIPGQLLLNVLEIEATSSNGLLWCTNNGPDYIFVLGNKPLALRPGRNLVNVACTGIDPFCSRVNNAAKDAVSVLNNFLGGLNVTAPNFTYINTSVNPQELLNLGGVKIVIGSFPSSNTLGRARVITTRLGTVGVITLSRENMQNDLVKFQNLYSSPSPPSPPGSLDIVSEAFLARWQTIIEHEMSHLMGMGHSDDSASLMYPYIRPEQGISTPSGLELTRGTLKDIYGSNTGNYKYCQKVIIKDLNPSDNQPEDGGDPGTYPTDDWLHRFFDLQAYQSSLPGDLTPTVTVTWSPAF